MFLAPAMLLWGLLLLIPLILYFVRPRPRSAVVTTLPFFRELALQSPALNWWRWMRRMLSLALTLTVIIALVMVLAQWVGTASTGDIDHVVLLFDVSASMESQDRDGRTRLQEAVAVARSRLHRLSGAVSITVIAYDRQPRVLVPATRNRREVLAALDELRVRPLPSADRSAIDLARTVAAPRIPAEIWHFTDHSSEPVHIDSRKLVPGGADAVMVATSGDALLEPAQSSDADQHAEAVPIHHIVTGLSDTVNVGITAFQLRRAPLQADRFEAFVQVAAAIRTTRAGAPGSASPTVTAELRASLAGEVILARQLTLRHAEPVAVRFAVPGAAEKVLRLEINASDDCLPLDNIVLAHVPEITPVTVLWSAREEDPFTKLALQTLAADGHITVTVGPPDWPVAPLPDIVIFDGWLPESWPAERPVVAIDPPDYADGPLVCSSIPGGRQVALRVPSTKHNHPLLYKVVSERIRSRQTSIMQVHDSLSPLWLGPAGPVLVAGEFRNQRVCILAADPDRSATLPLEPSFPILLGNAVYWTTRDALQASVGENRRTGERIALDADLKTGTIQWEPATEPRDVGNSEDIASTTGHIELDRQGIWQIAGESQTRRGSAALLSQEETLLGTASLADRASVPGTVRDSREPAPWKALLERCEPTTFLLGLALFVLVLESWWYHRWSVL